MWNMAGYFLRVTQYFDEPLGEKRIQNMYQKKKKLRIKYKVLENCVTKRGIRLYIFTCSQSYSCDIFNKLDNNYRYQTPL